MMQRIVAADVAAMSKVSPEIPPLGETESEWWLGLFGIDKSSSYRSRASWTWPRWRDHVSNPLTANMRLRVEPFDGGIGVVLAVPDEDYEQYVGWANATRADQLATWVGFLNREIAELWSLWDGAGRPTADSPPAAPTSTAPQSAAPQSNRIGRRLADGRFEVVEWLGVDAFMGAALARDHEHDAQVRLTFSVDVAGSVEDVRALLARELPDLAPVVYLGQAASDDGWATGSMMMAERMTRGAVAFELPSGRDHARELAAAGARLASKLLRVHRAGVVLGTLRPESTFLTSSGAIELLCRGERLWMMPRPNMTRPAMLPPWRPGYQAPELMLTQPLLRDPAPSADVFSIGVMLASALLDEFVYDAGYLTALIMSQREGTHLPLPETPLGRLLARCLLPDPSARPTLEELEQTLLRQPD